MSATPCDTPGCGGTVIVGFYGRMLCLGCWRRAQGRAQGAA